MREHQIVITLKPDQFLRVQKLAREAGAKSMGMFVRQQLLAALGIEGQQIHNASSNQMNLEPMVTELKRLHGELRDIVAEALTSYPVDFGAAAVGVESGELQAVSVALPLGLPFTMESADQSAGSTAQSERQSVDEKPAQPVAAAVPEKKVIDEDDDDDGSRYSIAARLKALGQQNKIEQPNKVPEAKPMLADDTQKSARHMGRGADPQPTAEQPVVAQINWKQLAAQFHFVATHGHQEDVADKVAAQEEEDAKDIASKNEIGAGSAAKNVAEPGTQFGAGSAAKNVARPGTEFGAGSAAKIEGRSGTEFEGESEREIEARSGTEFDDVSEAEIEARSATDFESGSQSEIEARSGTEFGAGADIEAMTEAEIEAMTEAEIEAMTEAEIEAMTEAEIEAMTEAEIEAMTEAEIEAMSESNFDSGSGAKVEAESTAVSNNGIGQSSKADESQFGNRYYSAGVQPYLPGIESQYSNRYYSPGVQPYVPRVEPPYENSGAKQANQPANPAQYSDEQQSNDLSDELHLSSNSDYDDEEISEIEDSDDLSAQALAAEGSGNSAEAEQEPEDENAIKPDEDLQYSENAEDETNLDNNAQGPSSFSYNSELVQPSISDEDSAHSYRSTERSPDSEERPISSSSTPQYPHSSEFAQPAPPPAIVAPQSSLVESNSISQPPNASDISTQTGPAAPPLRAQNPVAQPNSNWATPAMSADEFLKKYVGGAQDTNQAESRDPLSELLGTDNSPSAFNTNKVTSFPSSTADDDDAFDVPLSILARRQQLAAQIRAIEDKPNLNDPSNEKTADQNRPVSSVPPQKPNKPQLKEEPMKEKPDTHQPPEKNPQTKPSQSSSAMFSHSRPLENSDDDTPFSGGPPPKRKQ